MRQVEVSSSGLAQQIRWPAFAEVRARMLRRAGPLWALAANASQAAGPFLALLVLARLQGLESAGAFAFAQAVSTPLIQLASLQLKTLVLTHSNEEFGLEHAVGLRLISLALGGVSAVIVLLYAGVFAAVVLLGRLVDLWAEVYQSHWQREGAVDRAAVSALLRSMMLVCVYAAAPSLELAASVYLVLSLLVLVTFEASAQEFRVAFAAHVTRRMIQRGAALGAVLFLVAIQSSFPRLVLERQGALEALGAFGVMAFVLQAGNLAASSYGQGMLPQFREATWLQLLRWILVPAGVGILALFAVFAGRDTCLRLLGAQELRGAQDILLALGLTQVFAWPAAVAGCALTAKRMYSFQVFQSALLAGVSLGLSSIVVPRAAAVGVAAVIGFCACLMLGLSLLALWWRERWLKGTERR